MSDSALAWLDARARRAPATLVRRMRVAVAGAPGADVAERLGTAAAACLRRALELGDHRDGAFELLAADALLTHACEAAVEADCVEDASDALDRLFAALGPAGIAATLAPEAA